MSPVSYGYFVHANSHQVIRIHDHAVDSCSRPGDLGMPANTFRNLDPVRNRIEVLTTVLSAGWIRVRSRGAEANAEHCWEWQAVIDAIVDTVDEIGFGPMTWLVIRHIGTRQEIGIQVSELQEMVRENRIEEFIENIG